MDLKNRRIAYLVKLGFSTRAIDFILQLEHGHFVDFNENLNMTWVGIVGKTDVTILYQENVLVYFFSDMQDC